MEIIFLSFHCLSVMLWPQIVTLCDFFVYEVVNISLFPHSLSILMYFGCVHKNVHMGFIKYAILFFSSILFEKCILYITCFLHLQTLGRGVFISDCGFISLFLKFLSLVLFYGIRSDIIQVHQRYMFLVDCTFYQQEISFLYHYLIFNLNSFLFYVQVLHVYLTFFCQHLPCVSSFIC